MMLFVKGEGNFILTSLLLLNGQAGWLGTGALHIEMHSCKSWFRSHFQQRQTVRCFIANGFGARAMDFPVLGKCLLFHDCCCLTLQ